jgi:hypothetical protein
MHLQLHAMISCNKYPQKAPIGGFRAENYANDQLSGVVTVYFRRAAAATPSSILSLGLNLFAGICKKPHVGRHNSKHRGNCIGLALALLFSG